MQSNEDGGFLCIKHPFALILCETVWLDQKFRGVSKSNLSYNIEKKQMVLYGFNKILSL